MSIPVSEKKPLRARILALLPKDKRLRILTIAAAVLLALFLLLHPHGTKTYLVLGMDNYGSLNETGRSDVMMLVSIDFTRTDVTAITFTRDLLVKPEGQSEKKLNAVVRASGEEALCELMESTFGVPIDGWFRVNFTTVIELVDAIGGARVDLTAEEARYVTRQVGEYPDHPLAEGMCHLNGAQALAYARCRQLDNDMGRGERQNKLIAAMVQSTKRMTAANIASVFSAMKHAWRSSLSGGEQLALLGKAIWLRGADVRSIGVPFEGTWGYGTAKSGASGVKADLEENRRLLTEALNIH